MKENYSLHAHVVAEEHFKFYFLAFRSIGLPFISQKNSKLYTLYSAFMALCAYSFLVAMILELFIHNDNLQHIMQNMQACTAASLATWTHICIR
jgi:hypothetical protein